MKGRKTPVKGFKATNSNGMCRPAPFARQEYRVGETYSLPDGLEPIICERGFHFCDRLYEVFSYYPPNAYTRVFAVEAFGTVLKKRRDTRTLQNGKCVTDRIRIVRELSRKEILDQIERESANKRYQWWQRAAASATLKDLKTASTFIEKAK